MSEVKRKDLKEKCKALDINLEEDDDDDFDDDPYNLTMCRCHLKTQMITPRIYI